MHGRPKLDRPPTATEIEADFQKAATYQRLVDIITLKRSQHDLSLETFELIEQFLKKNPDYYTLWNYRKEILCSQYPSFNLVPSYSPCFTRIPLEQSVEITTKELALSTAAILKNPKSYGAWYHRIWIIQRFVIDIKQEIELCNQFLNQDQRNFHCWNYRRYLINTHPIPPIQDEYQYTTMKLSENFSNYSSYHHRSIFLPSFLSSSTDDGATPRHLSEIMTILDGEFQLIESAIFTEPDDQSIWWYYMFILQYLSYLLKHTRPDLRVHECYTGPLGDMNVTIPSISTEDWSQLLYYILNNYQKQYEGLKELQSMESSCKWILIGLLTLIQSVGHLLKLNGGDTEMRVDENLFVWNSTEKNEDYEQYLQSLCELDANRRKCHEYRFGRGERI